MGRDSSRHAVLETSGDHVKRLMGLVHTAHKSDLDFKLDYVVILRVLNSHQLCYVPKKNYLEKCLFGF